MPNFLRLFRWSRARLVAADQRLQGICKTQMADAVEREVAKLIPAWNPPVECADVADETLARYRRSTRLSHPGWTETQIEWLARLSAMANLRDRAEFRREIAEYTHGRHV